MTQESLLLSGDAYLNRKVAGVAQGLKKLPGIVQCQIKLDADIKENLSKSRAAYGQAVASVAIPKPVGVELSFNEFNADTLAIAFQGVASAASVTGASVTDEVVTAAHDIYLPLVHANVSAVVVTNSGGSTTYTETTDYEVDYELGFLLVKSTGTIADAASLKVDYTYATAAVRTVKGGTDANIYGAFKLKMNNLNDGLLHVLDIPKLHIASKAVMDFLKSDFVDAKLAGTGLLDTTLGAPFALNSYTLS